VKGAPHRELAIQFIEFVLSEEGQRLWNTRPGAPGGPRETALRRLPIMPAIYQHAENMTDRVDPYRAAGAFNKSSAREKTFPILGELIEFSCIDNLDELRVVGSRLGRFPFDQQEALRRAKEWGAASPARQLELREKWIKEFRDEYRGLEEGSR
jgi:ABC-type glycerol-3-phosphate transport system substrate-binding protein